MYKKTTSNGMIENVSSHDKLKSTIHKSRGLNENMMVNGFLTIIKNKGRADEKIIQRMNPNLLTTSGRDFFHAQLYTNVAVGTKGGNAIAVSDDATNPVAGDTTLVGEITTGGLTRVQASTISHTLGTNVTTLEEIFLASAVFTNIHKAALFNQDTIGGQMTHAREFDADVDLQIGDTLTVKWTLTLG